MLLLNVAVPGTQLYSNNISKVRYEKIADIPESLCVFHPNKQLHEDVANLCEILVPSLTTPVASWGI